MKIGGSILGALAAVACLPGSASTEEIGNWNIASAQGHTEYSVGHGPGNSVLFSYDEGASAESATKNTNVFITITGKEPHRTRRCRCSLTAG
jgi:hypothetical protein